MDIKNINGSEIEIKIAKNESIYDFNLCASDFIEFIDNFEELFLNKKLFILTAYYQKTLVGIVVAEDKTKKVDSIEKIVPIMILHLIYVNPNYRNRKIGQNLLVHFITIQKKNGIAAIHSILPQKHVIGINFLEKNDFYQKERKGNKILLELKLWNDYGIGDCHIIGDNINDLLS
ncbi:MAG: GNAT family N-acetyltransferase [Promethearchaeota archaeon]